MIGWIVTGAWLGLEHREAQRRKLARKEARAKLRRESPMPTWVWVVWAILMVASVTSPAAIPGMAIIGVVIWVYARNRRREHDAWLASQQPAPPVDVHERRAQAFDRQGMPAAAQAERDLRDIA